MRGIILSVLNWSTACGYWVFSISDFPQLRYLAGFALLFKWEDGYFQRGASGPLLSELTLAGSSV